jgi:hypothetical protein
MADTLWLIVNSASGSYDADFADDVRALAAAHDASLTRVIMIPDDDVPTKAQLVAAGVGILAIYTGDGTINSAVRAAADWDGEMLVLPGGTMNLLARSLHGDASAHVIVETALAEPRRYQAVSAIRGVNSDCDIYGLVGLFAGPTTAWGDVRETLRHFDIGGLIEAVPRAIDATFGGDDVRVRGSDTSYPAIYVEPVDGRLRLMGFRAGFVSELFEHGWAWLNGDFRDGPHDPLGHVPEVIIDGEAEDIGLLLDGERGRCHTPLTLRAELSPLRFIATKEPAVDA